MDRWTDRWPRSRRRTRRAPTAQTLERARRALLEPGVDVAVIAQVFGLRYREVWELWADTHPGLTPVPARRVSGSAGTEESRRRRHADPDTRPHTTP